MNQKPLVSIILPTYNRGYILPRAINSVLKQDLNDWEIILWDDGSTDNTSEVVKCFSDKRIKYFNESNHGMSYALNQAIDKSCGHYIAFLDDDDEWRVEKTTLQIQLMTEHPEIDLVFGNFMNINVESGKQGIGFDQNTRAMRLLSTERIGHNEYIISNGFLKSLAISNYIAFDSVLIRREIIKEIGNFNESLRNAQDFEFWWRFGLADGKPAFTKHILINRFKYPQGLSSHSVTTQNNHFKALDSCVHLSKECGRDDLIEFLNPSYRNSWQNLITWYSDQGNIKEAKYAYRKSLNYGFQLGSARLIIQAMIKALIKKSR